jgi:signal transduction histidine kinase
LTQEKIQSTAFLESISHEIRTPLNGIIGYAEYIQHTSHESMIQFPAQIIFESSQHLLRLIDNLLDLTEIETERKKVKKNLFELNASLEDVCKTHLSRSSKKNIALRYEYDTKCPRTVILDESLLRKIISNLLDNAIVFSKDIGEIVLTVHYLKNVHSLYISIKDDGHGIPEKMHSHVFDKFWQIEDFIANAHGGSALGLALTQKMVAMMGGEINFNSSENVGSIFYFTLPLEENGSIE